MISSLMKSLYHSIKKNTTKNTDMKQISSLCMFFIMSSPVSRVLSLKTVIYLRRISLHGSSRPSDYRPDKPIQSALLRMGFTWHKALPQCRWALTPPFHPCLKIQAVYFCCTFLRVASTGISPASCPAKLGLSSSTNNCCCDRSDCSSCILSYNEVCVNQGRSLCGTDFNVKTFHKFCGKLF